MKKARKVIVAMSGGVDSSTTAALLVKKGYQVEGVYLCLFEAPRIRRGSNTLIGRGSGEGADEYARAVAGKLSIPFRVLDFRKEFKEKVIDYFLDEFAAGRTPNPCVVCNQKIKFSLLLKEALKLSYDFIATGHYARIKKIHPSPPLQKEGDKISPFSKGGLRGIFHLLTAADKEKDQSYFLYNLTQKQLKHILFPIGDYKKSEIYKMADKWQLPYRRGESFDICFLAGQDHRVFLKKYLGVEPGRIVNTSGKFLGKHQGLAFYTIGQRADVGGPGPFYVVELNTENNIVVVTNNPCDPLLYKKSLIAGNVNWIAGKEPKLPLKCKARIRYRHEAVAVIISNIKYQKSKTQIKNKKYQVNFIDPQRAVTPGQSVVFYKRNEVLGGGVIDIKN